MPGRPGGTLRKVRGLMSAVEGLWDDLEALKAKAPALAETSDAVEDAFDGIAGAYKALTELETAFKEKVPDEPEPKLAKTAEVAPVRTRPIGKRALRKALDALSDNAYQVYEDFKRLAEPRMQQRGDMDYRWGGVSERMQEMAVKTYRLFEAQKAPAVTPSPPADA